MACSASRRPIPASRISCPGKRSTYPIDIFLDSLASAYREQSIGLVLTGTGSDGSRGIRAINEAGGMVLVQLPETAGHERSRPRRHRLRRSASSPLDGHVNDELFALDIDAIWPIDARADGAQTP
jgi:hypothetical protein